MDEDEPKPGQAPPLAGQATEGADTIDAWLDRSMEAMQRMHLDEEYRKEVAKRVS